LETGYTGKPYDAVTGLSDYGFRDYSPKYARFITEAPYIIRIKTIKMGGLQSAKVKDK